MERTCRRVGTELEIDPPEGVGWGGRLRTFNLLIQSQLRYRCATPQTRGLRRPPILASAQSDPLSLVLHMLSTPVVAYRRLAVYRPRPGYATGYQRTLLGRRG